MQSRLLDFFNLFIPGGRSGRQEFLTGVMLSFCISVALMGLIGRLSGSGMVEGPWMILVILAMLGLPTLTAIRRIHDLGEATEHIIYLLLPIVGAWHLLRLLFQSGQAEANEFGADPRLRMTPQWRIALGLITLLSVLQPFLLPVR